LAFYQGLILLLECSDFCFRFVWSWEISFCLLDYVLGFFLRLQQWSMLNKPLSLM
jgi:hypothetical protein